MEKDFFENLKIAISINHKISSYFIELAKAEFIGDKKEILNNPILINLFELGQEYWRNVENQLIDIDNEYLDEMGSVDVNTAIASLRDYITQSYVALRYIPRVLNQYDQNGKLQKRITEADIYVKDNYKKIRGVEYAIALNNIDYILKRLNFEENLEPLSFIDKEKIILDISEKEFYKNYEIKQIKKYIEDLKSKKGTIEENIYNEIYQKLIEQKYIYYYQYLNKEYNGTIQKNDQGYFGVIKEYLENDAPEIILEMNSDEINTNIDKNLIDAKEEFKANIREICKPIYGIQEQKIQEKKQDEVKLKENKTPYEKEK